jgi:TolB-like protein/class 3 adenylate cyclase/Tfp pilus assembly protein PilF
MKQPVERRLAAIFAADVAGYSRLMGADEEGTLERLKAHRRELIDPKISEHRGRIVKTTGDGTLAEFQSVVDAVRCAVEVQRAMVGRNVDLPEDNRITFRVGINLGDIILDGNDIYGDGVNVAARLEGLAEPGGICISRVVRDQIRDKLPYPFEDMGEQTVKNIARPMRAYALSADAIKELPAVAVAEAPAKAVRSRINRRLLGAAAAAAVVIAVAAAGWWVWSGGAERARAPATANASKPAPQLSIVVLPFENLSKDPDQEYFADGVTDDLTTDLSRIAGNFVIARTTAFTYKGKAVDVRQIGRDLGVRYVLEGSVRRSGNRVHVNVQLIDTASGSHVWADQFDTDRADLAQTQSEITTRLATTLNRALVSDASRRIEEAKALNPGAVDLVMRGWNWMNNPAPEGQQQAEWAFAQALQIDPRSIDARIGLAAAIMRRWAAVSDKTRPSQQEYASVAELLREALDRHPNRADAHTRMGQLLYSQARYAEARIEFETALQLDPNQVFATRMLGWALFFLGQPAAAIIQGEKSLRLDPHNPYLWGTQMLLGASHLDLGQADDAIELLTRARNASPRGNGFIYFNLASALALKGDIDAGKAALDEGLKLLPEVNSLAAWRRHNAWDPPALLELHEKTVFVGLRRLGFPEK